MPEQAKASPSDTKYCLLSPYIAILVSLRKPSSTKSDVFLHIVKGVGWSNPCVKIYVEDLYDSGGLLAT